MGPIARPAANSHRSCNQNRKDLNSDGSLPPGVQLVPLYDRTQLVDVTASTVLHNLAFGLRSSLFNGFFWATCAAPSSSARASRLPCSLVSSFWCARRGRQPASVGAVDFGIIVEAAVILVENIYRNFQAPPAERQHLLQALADGAGARIRRAPPTRRTVGVDRPAAVDSDQRATDRPRGVLLYRDHLAAFIPLFTMQGVEGQIFSPMARTYAYALVGALLATFTVTPCLASATAGACQRG